MSNQVPIYSQVVPKSQQQQRQSARQTTQQAQSLSPHTPRVFSSLRYDPRTPQPGVTDPGFDPLNHNHGGNFGHFGANHGADLSRVEKFARESARRSARELGTGGGGRSELTSGGRQGRRERPGGAHVKQAEHKVNLRALSLNENAAAARANAYDRTPTEFVGLVNPYRDERTSRDYIPKDPPPPYRERDIRDCYDIAREHIISKENSKNSLSICHEGSREITSGKLVNNCDKEFSGRLVSKEISSHSLSTRENISKSSSREVAKLTKENLRDFSAIRDAIYENEGGLRGCPVQPEIFVPDAGNRVHSMKKSSSANRIGTVTSGEKRKFYCREWAFQKLAHCLEQRPVSKTCGALILGDAGSGKTTLCKELSQPGTGPSARQQRALQRRMIARHFLQGQNEASLTISEFIRTLVMQILNHSTEHRKSGLNTTAQSIPEENKKDETAPSAPPLEECSPMQTDQGGEGEGRDRDRERRLHSTMERIHEKDDYDDMVADIVERRLKVSLALDDDPKQLPAKINTTNPFLPNFQSPGDKEQKLYENHENLFLRNVSQLSKDNRNSRLFRQQSEPPLSDKKSVILQKSLSTDSKNQRNSSEIDERSLAPCLSFEDAKPSSASKSLFKEILEADEYNKERKNSDGSDSKDFKNPLSPGGNNTTSNNSKVSRIPVASFKYPNMSVLSSAENSPSKSRLHRDAEKNSASDNSDNRDANSKSDSKHNVSSDSGKCDEAVEQKSTTLEEELPEYQNILKPPNCPKQLSPKIGKIEDFGLRDFRNLNETLLNSPDFDPGFNVPTKNNVIDKNAPSPVKNADDMNDDVPPPIPSLPVNPRTVIANSYYEKLLSEPEIQQALLLHNLEKNPDDCFKKALLFPLLEIDPPKQCLFLLVDSIDETPLTGSVMSNSTLTKEREKNGSDSGNLATRSVNSSKTIAELLANHHHLFPQWLLLVCTARKQSKYLTKMFTGFRKISLDDLRRGHVTLDVQRYILGRLDSEPRLAQHVSRDAAQALDHLRIKSNGCFLYLERVLDGLADGSVALREIREIPGTLNGLYMWLCQRLFHQRKFAKVQPLLNVLLVAKCGVDTEMLYQCMLTINHAITREDYNKRLHLLRRILTVDSSTGVLQIFHHSFSEWLLDVKHCTRRFLCSEAQGHAALAMYYTLKGPSLSAQDVHRLVLHITRLEQHLNRNSKSTMDASVGPQMEKSVMPDGLDLHSIILLWVLDSGCDVRASLRKQQQAMQQSTQVVENQAVDIPEFLNTIIGQTLPRDSRVLRALLEMGAQLEAVLPTQPASVKTSQADASVQADREDPDIRASQISLEQLLMLEAEDEEEESLCFRQEALELFMIDPMVGRAPIHTLAQHGDQLAIQSALQAYKSAGGDMCPDVIDIADRAGQTALQLAARGGRPLAVAALLAAGADAGRPDPEGWTPLRAAAWAGHTDVVELLLKHGCEVDCVDSDHRTALRAAAWSGHEEIVRLLIAHGADVNKTDLEGRTALIAAAYMGHTDIVTHLLDHGADIDHADTDGRTALAVAALCSAGGGGGGVGGGAGGGGGCTQLLLERGANPTRADKDGMTPLLVAAFEGHKEVIELLLEAEADPEVADRAGRTPLWAAAAAGHAGAVRALLFWGCCVDTIDRDGRTVLSVAAAQGNKDVVRQLVDRGLDEHHRDNAGWTPLHYAAFEGHVEVCDVLLEAGAKVDENDNDGKGPLMLAAQEGHCRLMELLIDEWGAPVDQHSHDGKTALRVAALEGHYEAVRILVERGACVDALDADQRSTLYILALDNRMSMARYLIQRAGADVETRDSEGRTPLHVSAWQGHYEMVNLLLTVGNCNIDARDCERRTPLHSASWRGQSAVVRLLLSKGADPNAQCDQGATPLGIASQEGHEECVLWLLQHGANPKHSDHCGRTPAKVALRAGHLHVVRLLEHWGATPGITQNLQPDVAITNTNDIKQSLGVTRLSPIPNTAHNQGSPDSKRRSVHSSNSTKSSSNLTSSTMSSSHQDNACAHHTPIPPPPPHARPLTNTSITPHQEPANRSGLALTFAQQVARCGRRGGGASGAATSPLYATPPHSPLSDVCSPTNPPQHQMGILSTIVQQFSSNQSGQTNTNNSNADRHFCRDTHMRIILGRENKHSPPTAGEQRESGNTATATNAVQSSRISCRKIVGSIGKIARRKKSSSPIVGGKSKRNGIVTNPAMRLVANVRNGLDNAAANLRRTGVALAASASSNNPAVKTNAFQWRRETPL